MGSEGTDGCSTMVTDQAQTTSTQVPSERTRQRLTHIDLGRGVGIALVVLGHIVTGTPPRGSGWFHEIKEAIYTFHMPFFMYLSGYVFYFSGKLNSSKEKYASNVAKTANRLLVPFFV